MVISRSLPSNSLYLLVALPRGGGVVPIERIDRIWPFETEAQLTIITKKLGSAPILRHFIERMGVVSIIDQLVETHPNRENITHGEAVAGLVAYQLVSLENNSLHPRYSYNSLTSGLSGL